eukprot:TCALIF_03933-PA protein Name:"Similar to DDB_G0268948 Putative methyltransferase DDB_G0268948 (Dictyostelium discoideum)" AED:0.07 eAED:0.07 QI:0/0.5/0.44/0.66/0.75/0.66/9/2714/238
MNRERAVDVGCGSGQSTFVLQPHFKEIIGIDVSSTQIEEAKKLLNHDSTITFKVGPGESLPFLDRSCDLVTCCQTIHWLDIPKFYSEVDRILKPGGILAVFGYHFTGPSPNVPNHKEIEKLRKELYEITQPFWDSKRALVDQGYTTIPQIPYSNSFRVSVVCFGIAWPGKRHVLRKGRETGTFYNPVKEATAGIHGVGAARRGFSGKEAFTSYCGRVRDGRREDQGKKKEKKRRGGPA